MTTIVVVSIARKYCPQCATASFKVKILGSKRMLGKTVHLLAVLINQSNASDLPRMTRRTEWPFQFLIWQPLNEF